MSFAKKRMMCDPAQRVVCVGDSVLDVLVHVPQSFLDEHGLHSGGCLAISTDELSALLSAAAGVGTPSR